jgi:hypothetical protein
MPQFFNSAPACQWLRETALKGVSFPTGYVFRSFVLYGNEDAPEKIELYESEDPLYSDPYKLVDFTQGAPIYCTVTDCKGK